MALQQDRTLKGGITVRNAYFRIVALRVSPLDGTGQIEVAVYANKASRDAAPHEVAESALFHLEDIPVGSPRPPSTEFTDTFGPAKLSTRSLYNQAYIYLRTLPEFIGARDV